MKVAALIPARAKSRRLHNKNWQDVGGVPLWMHAVDHAIKSGVCHVVAVSTDDEKMMAMAFKMGARVIAFHQPQFPQTYNVMLEVVRHADEELQKRGYGSDAICLLQPTSPLRTPDDVRGCIESLTLGFNAVVSVIDAEDDIAFERRHAGRLEKLPPIVRPNGAVYVIKTEVLRQGESWYGDFTYGYPMPKERSIDIDNPLDLEVAQLAWNRINGPGA